MVWITESSLVPLEAKMETSRRSTGSKFNAVLSFTYTQCNSKWLSRLIVLEPFVRCEKFEILLWRWRLIPVNFDGPYYASISTENITAYTGTRSEHAQFVWKVRIGTCWLLMIYLPVYLQLMVYRKGFTKL
jgi:hypothetical protein